MKINQRTGSIAGALAAILLMPSFLGAAYVVVMKDGSRMTARERFKVQGDLALITLPNGNLTQISLSKVDVAASDKLAKSGVGDATVLQTVDSTTKTLPSQKEERTGLSLQEVARQRRIREDSAKGKKGEPAAKGSVSSLPVVYPERDVANQFVSVLEKEGVSNIGTFVGATKGTLRIELTADREEQVFKALAAIGKRYSEMKASTALAPERIELNMKTTTGEDAGSFSFDITQLQPLIRGEMSPQEFFAKNVIL